MRPPSQGFELLWKRCRECGRIYRYVHQPHSLANPIRWTPCGHSIGHRDLNCDELPVEEAIPLLVKQLEEADDDTGDV
jgi:hypothetical protein